MPTPRPRLLVVLPGSGVQSPPFADLEVETLVVAWHDEEAGNFEKLAFRSAIARGFDLVAIARSAGAAAALPELVGPLIRNEADACCGSRPASARGLRHRLATTTLNRLLRARLADPFSGSWAYAVTALTKIPFQLNSPGAVFDIELLVQMLLSGARIREVPVTDRGPTRASLPSAVAVGLRARAQELSLFYDRKFDCTPSTASNVHYKPRLGFKSTHSVALELVPPDSRVLDIGCAGGYFGQLLRAKGCQTTGIDRFPLDEGNALDAFYLHDLDSVPLPVDVAAFDCAVMLDVIEHLRSPETFVDEFRASAAKNPGMQLIISTANVAFVVMRLMLLFGQFNYGKRGILDLTHTRLFTFGTFRRLFEQSGYEVLSMRGIPAPFPLALGNSWFSRLLLAGNTALIRISKRLFAFQILAVVRARP